MKPGNRIAVMQGSFDSTSFEDLIQVVGISRQFTGIELRGGDGRPTGALFIKSGMLVAAFKGEQRGEIAFGEILGSDEHESFLVYRLTATPKELEPIGVLTKLMLQEENGEGDVGGAGEPADLVRQIETSPPSPAVEGGGSPPAVSQSPAECRGEDPANGALAGGAGGVETTCPQALSAIRPESNVPPVLKEAGSSARRPTPDQRTLPREKRGAGAAMVGVHGPKGGSGKTTVAVNLAILLSEKGYETILVDADVPGDIVFYLGTRRMPGCDLFDALSGRPLDEVLLRTVFPRLTILPGAQVGVAAAEVYDHPKWSEVLSDLRMRADVVVFDTGGSLSTRAALVRELDFLIGVAACRPAAARSFAGRFSSFVEALALNPPRLIGVLPNRLAANDAASQEAMKAIMCSVPELWNLGISLPESENIRASADVGVPLALRGGASAELDAFSRLADLVLSCLDVRRREVGGLLLDL